MVRYIIEQEDNEDKEKVITMKITNAGKRVLIEAKADDSFWYSICGFNPQGQIEIYRCVSEKVGLSLDDSGRVEIGN